MFQRAEQLEDAEKKRKAEAARQKHIAEMKVLAANEEQSWQRVENLLDTGRKISSVYDTATAILKSLYQLAEYQGRRDVFLARLYHLARKYASRPALIDRWMRCGWL